MPKIIFQHNYHTHTTFCHHAKDTVEEVVQAAIQYGYKTIGFSEHAPLKSHRNFRLNLNEIDDYINEVNLMKTIYGKQIHILLGLECEYHKSQYAYYKSLRKKVDYMILGNHNMGNPHDCKEGNKHNINLDQYGAQLVDACKSGLFSCIAHPDIIYRSYHAGDADAEFLANEIIDASLKYNIPLGFNVNGLLVKKTMMDYPNNYFGELVATTKCKVIIEADAHDVKTMSKASINRAITYIKKFKLEKNLIEKLIIK